MACDLQVTTPQNVKMKVKTKIFHFAPHEKTYPFCDFIVGFAGEVNDLMEAADYLANPDSYNKPPQLRGCIGLVLTSKKEIFYFSKIDKWFKVDDKYASIGSGAPIAFGALAAGSTPKQAIQAAIKHDVHTGYGVKTLGF